MFLNKVEKVHFIGIGGAGMSALAEILLESGVWVSGSDIKKSRVTERLESKGALIHLKHAEDNLGDVDMAVFSSAIPAHNQEVELARRKGISLLSRGELLAALMKEKKGIAVAGTHGKTTTASMTALILSEASLDPTVVIGGELNNIEGNAVLGKGAYLVAEADESDGSFLKLSPDLAIITNVEADHLDYYAGLEAVMKAFGNFIKNVSPGGTVISSYDCPNTTRVIEENSTGTEVITYGLKDGADLKAENLEMQADGLLSYEVLYLGRRLGKVKLPVPGKHNVCNSLAAIGTGLRIGLDFSRMCSGLEKFQGVKRRFEVKGEVGGILVVDDYAHHPTEVAATLEAANLKKKGRIITVFQPHRYSRTQSLKEEFATALRNTDVLILTEIYPAGEEPIPGISSRGIFESTRNNGHKQVEFIPDKSGISEHLISIVKPGDMVITMGAGDIVKVAEELVEKLKDKNRH